MNTNDPIEILITIPVAEELVEKLQQMSPRLRITVNPVQKGKEIPAQVWAKTEILYTLNILPEPGQAPNLRWVQFYFAGIDFAFDSPLLENADIEFTSLSGAGTPQVAEFAVMLMLSIGHSIPSILEVQRNREWKIEHWDSWSPLELRGSTVGIVGYGSIGREIARLLQPFDVKVLATKRDAMHPRDSGYIRNGLGDPEGNLFNRLYPPQALCSMLKECDFVVLTLPFTPETKKIIGKEELAAMKPGSFLINVGRGKVVDQDTLVLALKDGKIAGAALDVFEEEPLPENSLLWKLPNVIVTPHIAGNSIHYDERAIELFSENIKRYINGISLLNRIDSQHRY